MLQLQKLKLKTISLCCYFVNADVFRMNSSNIFFREIGKNYFMIEEQPSIAVAVVTLLVLAIEKQQIRPQIVNGLASQEFQT